MMREILQDPLIQAQAIDLNRQSQLYEKGVTSEGKSLGEYSPYTIQYKTQIAARIGNDSRADHVTLKDTGAFYNSFRFRNMADGFIIGAETIKDGTDDLAQIYGKNILGLSHESIQELQPEIIERLRPMVRTYLLTGTLHRSG
jgi:hypothetical protein